MQNSTVLGIRVVIVVVDTSILFARAEFSTNPAPHTLEIERNVCIAFTEVIESVASVTAAVLLRRIRYL